MANVVNKLWNMINMNTAEDVADEDYEEGADYNESNNERMGNEMENAVTKREKISYYKSRICK